MIITKWPSVGFRPFLVVENHLKTPLKLRIACHKQLFRLQRSRHFPDSESPASPARVYSPLISKQASTHTVCLFWLHSSSWKRVSTILPSAFTSAARVKTDVITLSKVEVSAALGETKERPGERRWEGLMVFFDWLAADGTPGVFIPHRQLISGACKSTWQVFTGAVNPADSIHFANCSDTNSLRREDQTPRPVLGTLVCVVLVIERQIHSL